MLVGAHHRAGVQQAAHVLVELHPRRQLLALLRARGGDVPLDPERAEERGAGAEREVVGAGGGVRARRPDVRADQLGRQQLHRVALDLLALQRVDVVAAPRPGRCAPGSPGRRAARPTSRTRSRGAGGGSATRRSAGRPRGSGRAPPGCRAGCARRRPGRGCGPTSGRRSGTRAAARRAAPGCRRRRRDGRGRAPAATARAAASARRSRGSTPGARGRGRSPG